MSLCGRTRVRSRVHACIRARVRVFIFPPGPVCGSGCLRVCVFAFVRECGRVCVSACVRA